MKKLLTFILCASFATMLCAQSAFTVAPYLYQGGETQHLGEAISQNHKYVAGTDQLSNSPMMWNVETGDIIEFTEADSLWVPADSMWNELDSTWDVYEGYWDVQIKKGSFHAINNAGKAVGSLETRNEMGEAIAHPILADITTNSYTYLYMGANDAGCEAYGITEDGNTILGFYFDGAWTTHACVWTNNGQTRTDLPKPTTEQFGCPIDYVSARWISGDGNIILGYAQDATNGAWVAMLWRKSGNSYVPECIANPYFQPYTYDDNGEIVLPENPKPYFQFHPTALSYDGNYVALKVLERHNPNDWDNIPLNKAARYCVTTGVLEVLNTNQEYDDLEIFGIANNGTCVGRMLGAFNPETWSQPCDGVIWRGGETEMTTIATQFANDIYMSAQVASALSHITSDNAYVTGYAVNEDGEQTIFVVQIGEPNLGIENVENNQMPVVKGIYDLSGRKLDRITRRGIYIVDGKKVVVR